MANETGIISDNELLYRDLITDLGTLQLLNPHKDNNYLNGAEDKVTAILEKYFNYKQK
jgi:hypothetical protein